MGSKISIDKQVHQLEDMLSIDLEKLQEFKLDNSVPEEISQNIKVKLDKILKKESTVVPKYKIIENFKTIKRLYANLI